LSRAPGPAPIPLRRLARLKGARQAALPRFVPPQLATPQATPPAGADWLHEIKFDGYRTLVRIDSGRVTLLTRGGHDWTARYGSLAAAFEAIACQAALLDGEIVVQDETGVSSFARLQDTLAGGRSDRLLFYAFDCLHLDGWDLTPVPLVARKRLLEALIRPHTGPQTALQWSEHLQGDGATVLARVCDLHLEGLVSKRAEAPYRSGRSPTWIKCKCVRADRFVVVGYTTSDAAGGLAALHLADRTDAGLAYVGKTGSGFSQADASRLTAVLAPLARPTPPVTLPAETDRRRTTWVEPVWLVDVRYATRTADGLLRHAVFRGLLRDDAAIADTSPPAVPAPDPPIASLPAARYPVSDGDLKAIWVSHPDRRMFATGPDAPTKLDVVLHYARVAPLMLPELAGRPLSLLRCPTGDAADCFFQRHAAAGLPEAVARVALPVSAGRALTAPHPLVEDVRGLLALAQFGVVEFHPWGCRADRPEAPDRLVFDLDPDEGLAWQTVAEAACLIRDALADLGLAAFVKSSGGKGLHIHVPLCRGHGWPAHGRFAEAFARALCQRQPLLFTRSAARRLRRDRIYLDHLRNRRGATAVAAWSLRARPGLPVARPLAWTEIAGLEDPASMTIVILKQELPADMADPWRDIANHAVALTDTMARAVGLAEL
jgi:DNA ligase D